MSPNRLQRIREILVAARLLPVGERTAYLEQACADDIGLKNDIESLLEYNDTHEVLKSGGLDVGVDEGWTAVLDGIRNVSSPTTIGSCEIVGILGEGGMGTVYEAVQASTNQRVAVKVVRGAYVDEHHIKLFRREIRTMALLKHPNIAALYDAGRTEEGRHYFVMELVRGTPLDEYLRSRPTDFARREEIEVRLRIFLQICDAIGHAHQRGVIHRDLKPSNIMVVARPGPGPASTSNHGFGVEVKVLDFGLARLTDRDVSMTTVATDLGKIQGTLAYMSPEQARGNADEIDLRSDIYALGVILYEMLTNERPYDVNKTLIHEAVRAICEDEPRRPSTISRTLKGDLETIALKALEKEPSRRYQSVSELASDIERFTSDQPIQARRPTASYQFRKLVARHKTPFGFVAGLFVLLLGFAVTMSVMFGVQNRERARAEREGQKAEQISSFLLNMLNSVEPTRRGMDVTVRDVLVTAAGQISESPPRDPEIKSALEMTIGNAYGALGLYDDAERHLMNALSLQNVLGDEHPETVKNLRGLGWLHTEMGNYAVAADYLTRAVEVDRRLSPGTSELSRSLNLLGNALFEKQQYAEAESIFLESLELRRELFGETSHEYIQTLQNVAISQASQGDLSGAESVLRQVVAVRRDINKEDNPHLSAALLNLGCSISEQGRFAEAEPILREALDMAERVTGTSHPALDSYITSLSGVLIELGELEQAEALFRQAVGSLENGLPDGHWRAARARSALGECLRLQGRHDEAEPLLVEACEALRRTEDAAPEWEAALTRVIDLYRETDRPDLANEFQSELEDLQRDRPPRDPNGPLASDAEKAGSVLDR